LRICASEHVDSTGSETNAVRVWVGASPRTMLA
jgi:hypothetical protein